MSAPDAVAGRPRGFQWPFARLLQARTTWFLLERYTSTGLGFVLTAILARGSQLDHLAQYLAAYALMSVFEPLFAGAINGYLLRLLRRADGQAAAEEALRTTFWLMQALAVVFVAGAIGLFAMLRGDHLITQLFFLPILFTPWKLFSAPLIARDQFMRVTPVQVTANIAAGVLRIGVALATHSLVLIPLLMCLEPLVTGPVLKARAGVRLFGPRPVARVVAGQVLRQLPALMGAMGLVCLFYRTPVMLARLDLDSVQVVRIALAMQVMTALGVIQAALADSLIGPLAHALDQDEQFLKLLRIGSSVVFVFGLSVLGFVSLGGEWALRVAFGHRAIGIGPVVTALAPLCLCSGLLRLATTVINLRGRPVMMVQIWLVALAAQAGAALLLLHWRSPVIIALAMPISLGLGLATSLLSDGTRQAMVEVFTGFWKVLARPSEWGGVGDVMLGASPARRQR